MGFEAGYLPVALMEGGGYLPYHFSGRDFGAKIQKRPRNSKNGAKFKNMGAKIQKRQKHFRHYTVNRFFFDEGPFYLMLVWSDHERGVEGS